MEAYGDHKRLVHKPPTYNEDFLISANLDFLEDHKERCNTPIRGK